MTRKRTPIHPSIKTRLGYPEDMPDVEVRKSWRKHARRVCKPCWELKYCPYGPLVEQSPLLPITLDEAKSHLEYAKKCLATGKVGEGKPLTAEKRAEYEEIIASFDESEFSPDPSGELTMIQLVGLGRDSKPTREVAVRIIDDLKKAVESGIDGHLADMSPDQKAMFEREVASFQEESYPTEIPSEIAEMACTAFGHICPVVYNAERITETIELRRSGRYIPFQTKMRVVRRDNYTCQHCGKHLLDNEVEFDHIIPHARGGSSEEHNIRLTCFDCNRDKSDDVQV